MKNQIGRLSKRISTSNKPIIIDISVIILSLVLSLAVWLPTRYDPFHWDSAGFFINSVKNLVDSGFNPLIATGSDFAHPPGFIIYIALFWKFIGHTPHILHLANFITLPILITSVYFFAKKWYPSIIAVGSAFLVGITPVVVAEYGQIYIDLPVAAFIFLSLALWHHQKTVLSIISLSLAALTKYTAFLLLPMFFITSSNNPKSSKKPYNLLLIPVFIVVIYLAYHYLETGWLLFRPGRNLSTPSSVSHLLNSFWYVFKSIFFSQRRFLITIPALTTIIIAVTTKKTIKFSKFILISLATLIVSVVFYVISGEFAMRYAIALYPVLYISSLGIIYELKSYLKVPIHIILTTIILISAAGFLYNWHPQIPTTNTYQYRPSSDLTYRDLLLAFRKATVYSEYAPKGTEFYGGFPENIYLSQPYQGYVNSPQNINLCQNFSLNPSINQIIYLHPYSPSQTTCRLLLDKVSTTPIQRYQEGGKWVELYQVTSTSSADLDKD